jgi:hypothetical protein
MRFLHPTRIVIRGAVALNGITLRTGDAAGANTKPSEILPFDLA